jgi:hypothetical protein
MGGLLADKILPVGMLEEDLIACGEIDNQLRSGDAVERRRGKRSPEVFADLDRESGLSDAEKDVRGDVAAASGEGDFRAEALPDKVFSVVGKAPVVMDIAGEEIGTGREPAGFVELIVGREVDLGHDAFDLSVPHNDGAVVEHVVVTDRRTENDGDFPSAEVVPDGCNGFFGPFDQEIGPEKVAAGIACDGQFREDDKGGLLLIGLVYKTDNFRCIILNIRYFNSRRGCCHPDKSETFHSIYQCSMCEFK